MTDANDDGFLGRLIEVAIITSDHRKTIEGLTKLGIGPWRIYTFSPANVTNQTYRGKPADFTLKVCFADAEDGSPVWEVIEPVAGPTIFQEFIDAHGDGIHHVAYDCNDLPFEERIAEFKRRGFEFAQGGSWEGKCHFAFFETEAETTTCLETIAFDDDWAYPEPEAWYPPRG